RAALAPTFVSGQLFLWDLRANALVHASISRRTNKAAARACHRGYWPETNVGASAARDAPGGRRSISQALKMLRLPLPETIESPTGESRRLFKFAVKTVAPTGVGEIPVAARQPQRFI
ncbi:hypothetical protein, partial [Pseudomonas juntendi]|uniref:hypothetical protein n=1 Tax=Pseudomonas juntendi TaxID=2666183 RepID=UPI001C7141FE